jgi:ech hydrogenase subunit D
MMTGQIKMRIESTLQTIVSDIKQNYNDANWRFCAVYAADLKDSLEVQWVFAPIGRKEELMIFVANAKYDELIPSISEIVQSAWIAEWELYEMMGVKVEGANKGLLLEPDAPINPLRKDAQ